MTSSRWRTQVNCSIIHAHGPATAKALSPSDERRVAGTTRANDDADRRYVSAKWLKMIRLNEERLDKDSGREPLLLVRAWWNEKNNDRRCINWVYGIHALILLSTRCKTMCIGGPTTTFGTDVSQPPAQGCGTAFQLVLSKRTSATNNLSGC